MPSPLIWSCAGSEFVCDRPLVMAVVNVTKNSFSGDGLLSLSVDEAHRRLDELIVTAPDIIDVGAESTKPGMAVPPSIQEEIDRLIPVVEYVASSGIPVSVDTSQPAVMRAAIHAGAAIINDVRAFQAEDAFAVCAAAPVGLVISHMQGDPRTMQNQPTYVDVVQEVTQFLEKRVALAVQSGISSTRIVIDPGFGFGKTLNHNIALFRYPNPLFDLGRPVLFGVSHKAMLGELTGKPVEKRLPATLAAVLASIHVGAHIVRVHDVDAVRDALRVWEAFVPLQGYQCRET